MALAGNFFKIIKEKLYECKSESKLDSFQVLKDLARFYVSETNLGSRALDKLSQARNNIHLLADSISHAINSSETKDAPKPKEIRAASDFWDQLQQLPSLDKAIQFINDHSETLINSKRSLSLLFAFSLYDESLIKKLNSSLQTKLLDPSILFGLLINFNSFFFEGLGNTFKTQSTQIEHYLEIFPLEAQNLFLNFLFEKLKRIDLFTPETDKYHYLILMGKLGQFIPDRRKEIASYLLDYLQKNSQDCYQRAIVIALLDLNEPITDEQLLHCIKPLLSESKDEDNSRRPVILLKLFIREMPDKEKSRIKIILENNHYHIPFEEMLAKDDATFENLEIESKKSTQHALEPTQEFLEKTLQALRNGDEKDWKKNIVDLDWLIKQLDNTQGKTITLPIKTVSLIKIVDFLLDIVQNGKSPGLKALALHKLPLDFTLMPEQQEKVLVTLHNILCSQNCSLVEKATAFVKLNDMLPKIQNKKTLITFLWNHIDVFLAALKNEKNNTPEDVFLYWITGSNSYLLTINTGENDKRNILHENVILTLKQIINNDQYSKTIKLYAIFYLSQITPESIIEFLVEQIHNDMHLVNFDIIIDNLCRFSDKLSLQQQLSIFKRALGNFDNRHDPKHPHLNFEVTLWSAHRSFPASITYSGNPNIRYGLLKFIQTIDPLQAKKLILFAIAEQGVILNENDKKNAKTYWPVRKIAFLLELHHINNQKLQLQRQKGIKKHLLNTSNLPADVANLVISYQP